MKLGKTFFALALLVLALSPAWAQEEKPRLFGKETEPRSYGSFELWYQYYVFDETKVFEEFFDKKNIQPYGLSVGFYPLRNLDLMVKAGYGENAGHTLGIKSGEPSEEEVKLIVIPVQAELAYRFDFFKEQFLVPTGGVGYDWWFFQENNEFSDNVTGEKTGWHATAGLAILLDRIDSSGSFSLMQEYSVENVFLNFEARWCYLQKGDGFDFSGVGYSVGLLFEF